MDVRLCRTVALGNVEAAGRKPHCPHAHCGGDETILQKACILSHQVDRIGRVWIRNQQRHDNKGLSET
jgi:hypothetical protein